MFLAATNVEPMEASAIQLCVIHHHAHWSNQQPTNQVVHGPRSRSRSVCCTEANTPAPTVGSFGMPHCPHECCSIVLATQRTQLYVAVEQANKPKSCVCHGKLAKFVLTAHLGGRGLHTHWKSTFLLQEKLFRVTPSR